MGVKKGKTTPKKGKVKVEKLVLNKESVKDLSDSERRRIKGGNIGLMNTAACRK
jgi:hypothetical protein